MRAALTLYPTGPTGPARRARRALSLTDLARAFPLPWSHYVLLVSARVSEARDYRVALPDEKKLSRELVRARKQIAARSRR